MGKSSSTPHQMLNRLMFFKPMGPNQPQVSINSPPVHSKYRGGFFTEVKFEVDWNGKI